MTTVLCPSAKLIVSTLELSSSSSSSDSVWLVDWKTGTILYAKDTTTATGQLLVSILDIFPKEQTEEPLPTWEEVRNEYYTTINNTQSKSSLEGCWKNGKGRGEAERVLVNFKKIGGTSSSTAKEEDCCLCGCENSYLCASITPTKQTSQNMQLLANAAIINSSFDPMFSINEQGIIVFVNAAATKVFGYTQEEFLGNNIRMICGGDHSSKHDAYMQNYLQTGITKIIGTQREVLARHQNGNEFYVELGISQTTTKDHGILFTAFIRDLTEHKQYIKELEFHKSLVQGMIDASFDPMFQIDETGIVHVVNHAATKLLGYTSEELLGHNISIICGKEHAARHDQYLKNYLQTGIRKIMGQKRETKARTKDGLEFPIELGISEVYTDVFNKDNNNQQRKRMFCGYMRDLTHIKLQQRRMRNTEAMMKDSFFGGGGEDEATSSQQNAESQDGTNRPTTTRGRRPRGKAG